MNEELYNEFLILVRLGLGLDTFKLGVFNSRVNWGVMQTLAEQQGLSGIVLDGIDKLPAEVRPAKEVLLQWIGEVLQGESSYADQQKASSEMALLFQNNYIRTYVLKGVVIAECYPKPNNRFSVDMDCYLMPEKGDFDAWDLGNNLIKQQGYEVLFDFYKNSTFLLPGLTVENHQFMVPFRGNETLTNLERMLRCYMREDDGKNRFEGTHLCRPPVMVSSLFLIEHAYSHFLHEGITWRHILDWMMYSRKHRDDIDWYVLEALIDEFGFRRFYSSFNNLGRFLLGEIRESGLSKNDKLMLADVWAPLDLHETVYGIKGKLSIVGNTWRARWKYHSFADISMLHALWILVKGYLFIKHPKL